ncbi:MAG: hypothetical protein KC897_13230 [Candidatus Omnitrophica bacterium]|nr:hypothetical protein [Candidatus Omnitrophota bacterium]
MRKGFLWGLTMLFCLCGCAQWDHAAYTSVATVGGAGVGYAINEDPKDAAIGGLAGGIAGHVVHRQFDKKQRQALDEAYAKGRRDALINDAEKHWHDGTAVIEP